MYFFKHLLKLHQTISPIKNGVYTPLIRLSINLFNTLSNLWFQPFLKLGTKCSSFELVMCSKSRAILPLGFIFSGIIPCSILLFHEYFWSSATVPGITVAFCSWGFTIGIFLVAAYSILLANPESIVALNALIALCDSQIYGKH